MKQILKNNYIRTFLILVLVLYCSFLRPNLPNYIKKLFSYTIFRIVIIFGIFVLASMDPQIALLFSIAFILTLEYTEGMTNISSEALRNYGQTDGQSSGIMALAAKSPSATYNNFMSQSEMGQNEMDQQPHIYQQSKMGQFEMEQQPHIYQQSENKFMEQSGVNMRNKSQPANYEKTVWTSMTQVPEGVNVDEWWNSLTLDQKKVAENIYNGIKKLTTNTSQFFSKLDKDFSQKK